MLFSSVIFIVCFLPSVIFLYYTVCRFSRTAQNVFLLIASLGFYAWGEPWFVLVMIFSIICNWLFGLYISRYKENKKIAKVIIATMLFVNLSIIFVFKYLMFTVTNINLIFNSNIQTSKIILPIGISFFTFQAISYVIDIYRGKGEAQKNPLNVGLYISFFPQLIAGPIVRYETIADQIMNRKETWSDFSHGTCRFLVGFGKKVILANNFALVADKAFNMPENELSVGFAWLGAICYTLQIYYDFSGYSDMAIGLGRMFGFHFPENFNYPYISKSTTEFWRRWHISLGSWFKDYVYIPLGGSRVKTKGRLIFNLFAVWGLTGLWHGANWTFIIWGLLYFASISLEKIINFEKLGTTGIANIAKHFYTMLLVIFGWVIFRSDNIIEGINYILTMIFIKGNAIWDGHAYVYMCENWFFLLCGVIFSMPIADAINKKAAGYIDNNEKNGKVLQIVWNIIYPLALIFIFLVGFSYLMKGAYNPFIYFNF